MTANQRLEQILTDFEAHEVLEAAVADHMESERSYLYHTYGFDVATTEREYLEFLYALVRLEKPIKMLESGTGSGVSTLVLLCAAMGIDVDFGLCAKQHPLPRPEGVIHRPELYSVDTRFVKGVELLARKYELSHYLTLRSYKTTLDFLKEEHTVRTQGNPKTTGWKPFNFCLFDSEQSVKAKEAEFALGHNLIAQDALLVFHDTSLFHPLNGPGSDYLQHIAKLSEQYGMKYLPFPWSRGLIVMRYPGPNLHE